jgi:hypothetical protein
MSDNTQGSTSGSSSSAFGKFSDQNTNLNTPAIQVGNAVRDGDEFVLIVQSRQGEQPKIWSSGDKDQMQHLVRSTYSYVAGGTLTGAQ